MVKLSEIINTKITYLRFWKMLIENQIEESDFTEQDFYNLKLILHPKFTSLYKIQDKMYIYNLLKTTSAVIKNHFLDISLDVYKSLELIPLLKNLDNIKNKVDLNEPYHVLDNDYCNGRIFKLAYITYIKIQIIITDNEIDFIFNSRPSTWILKRPKVITNDHVIPMKLNLALMALELNNITFQWKTGGHMNNYLRQLDYIDIATNKFKIPINISEQFNRIDITYKIGDNITVRTAIGNIELVGTVVKIGKRYVLLYTDNGYYTILK